MTLPHTVWTITVVDGPTFNSEQDKTLLDCLESASVPMLYHCREGFCGACRTRIIEGDVEYLTDPLAFIDDDEILPCCCRAKSHVKLAIIP